MDKIFVIIILIPLFLNFITSVAGLFVCITFGTECYAHKILVKLAQILNCIVALIAIIVISYVGIAMLNDIYKL